MKTHAQWNKERGDLTHRLNYNLNADSIVFDLGGYHGDWAQNIHNKHKCEVWIFEPAKEYYDKIVKRFENNDKVKVFQFGLSGVDQTLNIYMNGDATSTHQEIGTPEIITLKSCSEFMEEYSIKNVDLVKINIEGGEYELLETLIERDELSLFDNLQIQFHSYVDNHEARKEEIRKALAVNHASTYMFTVWENWKRNGSTEETD